MSFTLIKGSFHVVGYSPDGDSIRFKASDPSLWSRLSGPAVKPNARGHAQLRIEAIDALETHYSGFSQPQKPARAATSYLLSTLGIKNVVWNDSESKVIEAQDGTEGYILSRSTERNSRPVAFVFAGEAVEKDGAEVTLNIPILKKSLNYKMLARGLVYPMYYNGFFSDLRSPMTKTVKDARANGKGLWPLDRTTKGFSVSDLQTITEDVAIYPKLFRRIIEYMGDGGNIDGFKEHLQNKCDPLVRIEQVHFTRLDSILDIKEESMKLSEPPENMIFLDKVMCKKA
jgi:hypothetical protein